MLDEPGSVSELLDRLRDGVTDEARQEFVTRYFQRLAAVARKKLPDSARRMADQEDIALSTLDSFFRAAEKGRYPDLQDRSSLWSLLLRMAACKVANHTKREFAAKRGGGSVRGDSALASAGSDQVHGFDGLTSAEPTPDSVVALRETLTNLMEKLETDTLRSVAQLRLTGHSNQEIADKLQCVERTVERKLAVIRHNWSCLIEDQ